MALAALVFSHACSQTPALPTSPETDRASSILGMLDKDSDGKISKSEALDDMKQNFGFIDKNGDGGIDIQELKEVLKMTAMQRSSGSVDGSGETGNPTVAGAAAGADVFDRVEHHQADSDGVSIHYVTLGEGPVVLFIHGFPDFWYTWREQMAALCGDFKTVAMDTRANNKSGKPEGVESYTMPYLLADVAAVVKDLGVDSVTLVGHDWGGAISWRFAMLYPHLVNKLVICNLTHPKGYMTVRRNATPEQKANTQYITDFQTPGFENRLTPEALTSISAGNVPSEIRQRYLDAFSQSSVKGMLDYYRAAFSGLNAPTGEDQEPPMLTMPVLQFHGLKDKAVDKDGLRDTWNWINEDYTLVTVPSSGHWVQREAADLVSTTMLWWLKSRPVSESSAPGDEALEALSALPDNEPVVMLNLLEFAEDGAEAYRRHSAEAAPLIEARGGRVLYSGVPLTDQGGGGHWDLVVLVSYPSRARFLDLTADPEYQKGLGDLSAGLKRSVLYAFRQIPGTPPLKTVSVANDEEIFVLNLLRYKPGGRAKYAKYGTVSGQLRRERASRLELALQAEQPLVSDETWENLFLVSYTSLDSLMEMVATDAWQKANREHRQRGVDLTWAYPTRPVTAE